VHAPNTSHQMVSRRSNYKMTRDLGTRFKPSLLYPWVLDAFTQGKPLVPTLSGCVFWDCPAPPWVLPYTKVFLDQYRNFIVHSTNVIWVQFGQRLVNKLFLDMLKFSKKYFFSKTIFVLRKRAKNLLGEYSGCWNFKISKLNNYSSGLTWWWSWLFNHGMPRTSL
jgi:hypothetical protein